MSQGNERLYRRAADAFNQHDLGAYVALMDDGVEAVPRGARIEGSYQGHDGIRRLWENVFEVWPDFTVHVVEVRDLGDVTVAAIHTRGHGAGSDIPLDETVWQVTRWRHGKCVWWGTFDTRAEALEAADLSE
jgi:ketosteroid isomerase-like protein